MKDPQDCTYPHTRLCAHECCEGCRKQQNAQGWRKRQIESRAQRAYEEALAEDEAFALAQKHEGMRLALDCEHLGVCQERQPACPDCPRKTV